MKNIIITANILYILFLGEKWFIHGDDKELDAACRQTILDNHSWVQEWTDHKSTPPCVFGDILEQVPAQSINESLLFFKRMKQA